MEKESGKWIMYGVAWDDPECIHTVDEAIEYINEIGFLPLLETIYRDFRWKSEPCRSTGGVRMLTEIHGCGGRLSPEDMISYMASFLIKRQVLYRENGFRYLLITGGMDMILMRCMKMEKLRISIKRSWIISWKNMWMQNCIPTN